MLVVSCNVCYVLIPATKAYDRDYRDSEGILDELVPAIAIEDFALF